jgi:DNA repair protein RadC
MHPKDFEKIYMKEIKCNKSAVIYQEMEDIKDWPKEVFAVFYLNSQNQIISREVISIGILNALIIHPREVFRTAIIRNANSIIISHNHPSGNFEPSPEDIKITNGLQKAGEIIDIKVVDHVIVSQKGFYSFADNNEL